MQNMDPNQAFQHHTKTQTQPGAKTCFKENLKSM
jgi:hypothetical protein